MKEIYVTNVKISLYKMVPNTMPANFLKNCVRILTSHVYYI